MITADVCEPEDSDRGVCDCDIGPNDTESHSRRLEASTVELTAVSPCQK